MQMRAERALVAWRFLGESAGISWRPGSAPNVDPEAARESTRVRNGAHLWGRWLRNNWRLFAHFKENSLSILIFLFHVYNAHENGMRSNSCL